MTDGLIITVMLLIAAFLIFQNRWGKSKRRKASEKAIAAMDQVNKSFEQYGVKLEAVPNPGGATSFRRVQLWSDEKMRQYREDAAKSLFSEVGRILNQDEGMKSSLLKMFLFNVHMANSGTQDLTKNFWEMGRTWCMCHALLSKEPDSDLSKQFMELDNAWRATLPPEVQNQFKILVDVGAELVQDKGIFALVPSEDTIYSDPDMDAVQDAFLDGNCVEMLTKAKALVLRHPESAEAFLWLGKAHTGLKSSDEAIAAYKRAIELKPDYATAWFHLGVAYQSSKLLDDAISAQRQAVALNPKYAQAWRSLGMACGMSERYDDAIEAQKTATALEPNVAEAWEELGLTYTMMRRNDDALAAYKQAVKVKPDLIAKWYKQSHQFYQSGQFEKAAVVLQEAFALKPDEPRGFIELGLICSGTGRNEEAIGAYKQAINLKPDPEWACWAWAFLGNAYVELDRYDEAIGAYQEAIKQKSDFVDAWRQLGGAYACSRRWNEGIAALQQAIKLKPDFADAWNLLAEIYSQVGDTVRAADASRHAGELSPPS